MLKMRFWITSTMLFLFVLIYYFILSGPVPSSGFDSFDLAALKTLAKQGDKPLPTEIGVIKMTVTDVPKFALTAGRGFGERATMARFSFQVRRPDGYSIIDTAMGPETAARMVDIVGEYKQENWDALVQALSQADEIMVTHEHNDHASGIFDYPNFDELRPALRVSKVQAEQFAEHIYRGLDDTTFDGVELIDLTTPAQVAPGIVMIPAPGHTPGSVMYFVLINNGLSYLFIGDIAYTIENVTRPVDHAHLLRYMHDSVAERKPAVDLLAGIHELYINNPELTVIPAHGAANVEELIHSGKLFGGFKLE